MWDAPEEDDDEIEEDDKKSTTNIYCFFYTKWTTTGHEEDHDNELETADVAFGLGDAGEECAFNFIHFGGFVGVL